MFLCCCWSSTLRSFYSGGGGAFGRTFAFAFGGGGACGRALASAVGGGGGAKFVCALGMCIIARSVLVCGISKSTCLSKFEIVSFYLLNASISIYTT